MEKTQILKLVAVGVAGVLVGAGVGAGLAPQPEPVQLPPVIQYHDVIVEKNVTVDKPVLVDNGKLAYVEQRLEDMAIYEDASEVVTEMEAEDSAISLAVEEIKSRGFNELEKSKIFKDDYDLSFMKIYSDYKDLKVEKSDYDKEEYMFVIDARVKDDKRDVKEAVKFTVKVDNGEAELVKVVKA